MNEDNEKKILEELSIFDKSYQKILEKRKKILKTDQSDFNKDNKITILLKIFFLDVSAFMHCFLCLKMQLKLNIHKDHYKNELKKNIFDLTKNLLEIFKKDKHVEIINPDIDHEDKENLSLFIENNNFYMTMKGFRNLSITFKRTIFLFKENDQKWYNYFLEAQNNIFSIFKGMLDFSLLVMYSYPNNSKKYFEYEKSITIFYNFLDELIADHREAYTLRNNSSNLQEALHLLMLKQNFEKLILNDHEAYLETVKKYRKWASLLK